MARIVRRLLILMLLVGFAHGAILSAAAQDVETDKQAATEAATTILTQAVNRQFNAMYDLIHPDAMAIIPRAAAVGAFTDIYNEAQVKDATIHSVEMTSFTWGVTGKRYGYAAAVDFSQSYTDDQGRAQTLQDTMYLVKSGDAWRWFFGSDPDFVQSMIQQYGQTDTTPLTEGDLISNVVNDLDAYYRDVLSYTDYKYVTPGVVVVTPGTSAQTACGPASSGFWGFYCPPDGTLYLEESLLTQLQQSQDFAAAFVIAHEWAHHIQTVIGLERTTAPTTWNQVHSIELELMADCFAGAWAQDVDTRGLLEPDDIDEAIQFTIEKLGDPTYVDLYDPQAHGTSEMRVTSFKNGYEQGFLGCNVTL
jgi:predicted metalloprotease